MILCRLQHPSRSPSTLLGHFLRAIHDLKKLYPHDGSCSPGPRMSKRSMSRPSPGPRRDPTNKALLTTSAELGWRNNMPLSNNSGRLPTLCANALSTTYLMRTSRTILPELFVFVAVPGVPPTTIWPSAVSALWLCSQNQWRDTQPQGSQTRRAGLSLRHLDGSTPQSFPAVSHPLDHQIFLA